MKQKIFIIIFIILYLSKFWGLQVPPIILSGSTLIGFVILIYFGIKAYNRHDFNSKYILIYTLGILISCVYCQLYNGQDFQSTLWASYTYLGLTGYFIFAGYKLSYKECYKIIKYLAIIFCSGYLIQWLIYPVILFNGALDPQNISDGVFRMRLPGSIGAYILFFLGLNNYLLYHKKINLIYMVMGFTPILLQGFRSLTFLILIGVVYMIFKVKKLSMRAGAYLIGFLLLALLSTNIPLVQEKLDEMQGRMDSDQTFSNKDYVRNIALFYYWEMHDKPLEHIFGGGSPTGIEIDPVSRQFFTRSSSQYASTHVLAYNMGYYWNDLGIVGWSFNIGIISVLCIVVLIIRNFIKSKDPELSFVNCTLMVILLGSIMTSMELFRNGNLIIESLLLYLCKIKMYEGGKSYNKKLQIGGHSYKTIN